LAAFLLFFLALPAPVQTSPTAEAAFSVSVKVASTCLAGSVSRPQPAACTPVSQQVQDGIAWCGPAQDVRPGDAEQSQLPPSTSGTKAVLIRS